ncbi:MULTISPECIES: hypothetical protein [Burkholderia]|jgi:hypothetical protein|uniref:Immunity 22 family protein n=1 Tax=Burkholderia gladioli TaxID=28095 RepID=A0AAP8SCG1_BURGA|nr:MULTISPECIES: hypothetical protein [Burkholderia]AJX00802.1 hypothetical protein BM43_2555 [Burkholderia gladioli]ASD78582.1 hypothetical protein CEJ98_05875 [Burkholderia gladioli pv. gladioli]AWY56176.1 hypothetical protein A8H28_35280 [Burkholderia gladioli pv. gladioli]AYQ87817.1 hypothetical protein EDD84_10780 [Burkholderia gladioli]KGC09203.1 hypothetical protein DM48_6342 [Burkholderia gladioli]
MASRDYSEDEDFYTQNFEKKGVLSVWLGMRDRSGDTDIDTLQDLCGVGYYRLSDQENNHFDFQMSDIGDLLADLSYADSYRDAVLAAAAARGITQARSVLVQYDFAYDPKVVTRKIDEDPLFLGVFDYSDQ